MEHVNENGYQAFLYVKTFGQDRHNFYVTNILQSEAVNQSVD